jgi:dTMP kinase
MNMQGKLIVFEGGEGAGKTTQLARSQQWLEDSGILSTLKQHGWIAGLTVTREPGGTELGQQLRQLLLHAQTNEPIQARAELLLYAADRAQHVEQMLRPQLEKGMLILCDRYTDSTVAYQGYGRGLDLQLIQQLNQGATNGLDSDLTLWLDVEVEAGLRRTQQRGAADRMEQSALAFHQRVRAGFQTLAAQQSQRVVRIDANGDPDAVTQQIQSILKQKLSQWYPVLSRPS